MHFPNPVGLAAGFDKNARQVDYMPAAGFGFIEIGSVTAEPCAGNPKPRLWRLPESQALVVNYGLMNDGAKVIAFVPVPQPRSSARPMDTLPLSIIATISGGVMPVSHGVFLKRYIQSQKNDIFLSQ